MSDQPPERYEVQTVWDDGYHGRTFGYGWGREDMMREVFRATQVVAAEVRRV